MIQLRTANSYKSRLTTHRLISLSIRPCPNAQKTKSISFKRRHPAIPFVYTINGAVIQQVCEITDLEVILDEKMSFKSQIDHVVSRAKSILAWLKRFVYYFDDPWVIKKLCMTYLLPILEYSNTDIGMFYFPSIITGAIKSPLLYDKIGFRTHQRDLRAHELLLINFNDADPFVIAWDRNLMKSNTIDFSRRLIVLQI